MNQRSSHLRRRLATGALLLLAPLLSVTSPPPAQAAAPGVQAGTTTVSATTYPRKCFYVRSAGDTQSHRECYQVIRRLRTIYKVGYRDSLVNRTNRRANLECEASDSRSFAWGMSIDVKASLKAGIFASVEANVGASFTKTATSGTAVRGSITVPAKTTTYCDRVVYHERFSMRKCVAYAQGGGGESCRVFTFTAPSRRGWIIHDKK